VNNNVVDEGLADAKSVVQIDINFRRSVVIFGQGGNSLYIYLVTEAFP
jgi:hypothetical protein